jgi:hypothetical protein
MFPSFAALSSVSPWEGFRDFLPTSGSQLGDDSTQDFVFFSTEIGSVKGLARWREVGGRHHGKAI